MIIDRVDVEFGRSERLRVPPVKDAYPRLSLDLVDVAVGPDGTVLGTWTDAVERRELERTLSGGASSSSATGFHVEVVAQYAQTGEIVAQWEIWTTAVMQEYRAFEDGCLLGFSRLSAAGDHVSIFDAVGAELQSSRFSRGFTDVAVIDNGILAVSFDRYFRDELGTVLGLAMYTRALERTEFGDGAGYQPSALTVSGSALHFWDRNSGLIMSSARGKPIWPDQSQRLIGPIEPHWVLHSPRTNRWALVAKSSGGSLDVVLGIVDEDQWTTAGELMIREPASLPHQATVVTCDGTTIHCCVGRQWHSLSLDDLFDEWEMGEQAGP
ncbi:MULTISPECIES: hypothetical protein [Brevibacterium]|uniref:hypothetical protein n=1 Tax=Brevibacterium TaxID=1696 RepID=UPI0031D84B6D